MRIFDIQECPRCHRKTTPRCVGEAWVCAECGALLHASEGMPRMDAPSPFSVWRQLSVKDWIAIAIVAIILGGMGWMMWALRP